MTIIEWLESFWWFSKIIFSAPQNSFVMGLTSLIVTTGMVTLNHYSARRAAIYTIILIILLIGWYINKTIILGLDAILVVAAFRGTVFNIWYHVFIIIGLWMAWLLTIWPKRPIVKVKRFIIKRLRLASAWLCSKNQHVAARPFHDVSEFLESTITPRPEKTKEERIIAEIKEILKDVDMPDMEDVSKHLLFFL
jgi:hypothetical protein